MAATVINISILPIGFHLLPYFFSYFSKANAQYQARLALEKYEKKYGRR